MPAPLHAIHDSNQLTGWGYANSAIISLFRIGLYQCILLKGCVNYWGWLKAGDINSFIACTLLFTQHSFFHVMRLTEKAKTYACARHEATGHLYDGLPYAVHLNAVAGWASLFASLLHPSQAEVALAGAYVHDIIEDCRVNYSDIVQALNNIEVAEVAYLLATPKGRTRAERHCDAYYHGIANNKIATFVKICDRLANVEYSLAKGKDNHMLMLYCHEHAHFSNFLRFAYPDFELMWERLDAMLAETKE